MTLKDDRRNSRWFSFRSRLGLVTLCVLVISAAIAIRWTASVARADAQVTRTQSTSPRSGTPQRAPRAATQQRAPRTAAKSTGGQNVVAVVNGEPVTKQALGKLCLRRWGDETLESLVNKHLITVACAQRGIKITHADIDEEVARVAKKFNLSKDLWLQMLKSERNVSSEQYKRDIIWPTLALRALAADKLVVSQEDLKREMEAEYGAKVQVRMISLTSQKKAQHVLKLAQANPGEFPKLAKEYSEDPATASAKGLIPPVRKHVGEPAIEQVVFALQPGEISQIVKAANQYLIFRCERHIKAATISPQFQQATTERLKDRIVERNLRDAANELFRELQDKATIVNVLNNPQLRQKSPGVAAFVNDKPITLEQLMEECVARYGRDMLETEINFRILSQALKQRQLTVTKPALEQEIARAAESFGYVKQDGTVDVRAWVQEVTEQEGIGQQEYIRDTVWPTVALKQLVQANVEVTDEDLHKGFEANYGPRVEVLAIVLGNQRMAQEVWDMARKNKSREFFGQLAEQYSIESVSRANYGEIPPIRQHGGQPQIEAEAFRLSPQDDLSGIVAIGDKFVIMKYVGMTDPIVEKFEDVKSELIKDIHEKKLRLAMAEAFDKLRDAAQIDNFLAGTSQSGREPSQVPVRPVSTSGKGKRVDRATARVPVLLAPRPK